MLNKRDETILQWTQRNNPSATETMRKILENPETSEAADTFYKFMSIAFEAGREFQHRNPNAELDDPTIYL